MLNLGLLPFLIGCNCDEPPPPYFIEFQGGAQTSLTPGQSGQVTVILRKQDTKAAVPATWNVSPPSVDPYDIIQSHQSQPSGLSSSFTVSYVARTVFKSGKQLFVSGGNATATFSLTASFKDSNNKDQSLGQSFQVFLQTPMIEFEPALALSRDIDVVEATTIFKVVGDPNNADYTFEASVKAEFSKLGCHCEDPRYTCGIPPPPDAKVTVTKVDSKKSRVLIIQGMGNLPYVSGTCTSDYKAGVSSIHMTVTACAHTQQSPDLRLCGQRNVTGY